jgi:hypothetical protein
MFEWVARNGKFIAWAVLLLLLTIITIESHEANTHSAENNAILKSRKPCLMEVK